MKLIILIFFATGLLSGCNSYQIKKNCIPLNPERAEMQDFWACKNQWTFFH